MLNSFSLNKETYKVLFLLGFDQRNMSYNAIVAEK